MGHKRRSCMGCSVQPLICSYWINSAMPSLILFFVFICGLSQAFAAPLNCGRNQHVARQDTIRMVCRSCIIPFAALTLCILAAHRGARFPASTIRTVECFRVKHRRCKFNRRFRHHRHRAVQLSGATHRILDICSDFRRPELTHA